MESLSNYEAQEEYNRFQELVNIKENITKEEFEFIKSYDAEEALNFHYVGGYGSKYDYLNLNVYSEHEHDKRQFEIETGLPY